MFLSLDGDDTNASESAPYGTLTEMVERARVGDAQGFTALFQHFNGPICIYLARLVGNDELGRDLAQETFLLAWKNLPHLQGELHFSAWLYRIATNVARSHLRHERLIRWLPWMERDNLPNMAGPEESVSEMECVKQALACLAPQCRICLLLQLVGGFSQHEIAAMLGISNKSVGAYVFRGREQFRTAYRRLKGDSVL